MRRDVERLDDILDACGKITARERLGRERFDADENVQLALVHLVQVIGEATRGLSDELTAAYQERRGGKSWRCATVLYTATSRSISTSCGTLSALTFHASLTRSVRSGPPHRRHRIAESTDKSAVWSGQFRQLAVGMRHG